MKWSRMFRAQHPTRSCLGGISASELKTLLRQQGYRVPRDFYQRGSIAKHRSRLFRFRWWSEQFVVDVSCPWIEFDRWANSVDETITFTEWRERYTKGK